MAQPVRRTRPLRPGAGRSRRRPRRRARNRHRGLLARRQKRAPPQAPAPRRRPPQRGPRHERPRSAPVGAARRVRLRHGGKAVPAVPQAGPVLPRRRRAAASMPPASACAPPPSSSAKSAPCSIPPSAAPPCWSRSPTRSSMRAASATCRRIYLEDLSWTARGFPCPCAPCRAPCTEPRGASADPPRRTCSITSSPEDRTAFRPPRSRRSCNARSNTSTQRLTPLKTAPAAPRGAPLFPQQGNIVHDVLAEWWKQPQDIAPLFERIFARRLEEAHIPQRLSHRAPAQRHARRSQALRRPRPMAARRLDRRTPKSNSPSRSPKAWKSPADRPPGRRARWPRLRPRLQIQRRAASEGKLENPNLLQAPLYMMAARAFERPPRRHVLPRE